MKPYRMKNYLLAQFNKDKQGHTTFHRYCVAVWNDYLSICSAALVEPVCSTIDCFLKQEADKNGGWVNIVPVKSVVSPQTISVQ